jgi:hypothetical protein
MISVCGRAALLITVLWCGVPAWADDTADALAFFKEYIARSDRFDPGLADLYADDAAIRSKRIMPDGKTQTLSFSGAQWKALIKQAMPLAKQRGDRNTFRTVSAKPDGNSVVITAERYSHLKSYSSPFALLVTKDPTGAWKISAELTETRP